MSKKVLVIEQSLAVRGVAESLLRQNGFEVVTADSAEQAEEILKSSDINLILLSSDMTDSSGQPVFERFATEGETANIPLLLLHDQNIEEAPAYPPESVIGKPFTPREFISAIGPFLGGNRGANDGSSPFSGADFEEDLIDTALGLDKIEVDGAEVLEDDTGVYRKTKKKTTTESMIGFEFKVSADDTGKVVHKKFDSVTVPADEDKQTKPQAPENKQAQEDESGELEITDHRKPTPEPLSESSKLEISSDQYGLITSETADDKDQLVDDQETHDYEWFLNELRKETDRTDGSDEVEDYGDELPPSIPAEHQISLDSPPEEPRSEKSQQESTPQEKQKPEEQPAASTAHGEAIDKFISEFKKEVDKLTGDEPEKIDVATVAADDSPPRPRRKSEDDLHWVEGMEKLPPDLVRKISREMIGAVAKRVAEQIMVQIDTDVIYRLIKDAVDAHLEGQKEEKSR